MAPISLPNPASRVRVVVHERRAVAELLAGGELEAAAGELVDPELRAIARAVLALRVWREAADERVVALVRWQAQEASGEEIEALRREGWMRRRRAA